MTGGFKGSLQHRLLAGCGQEFSEPLGWVPQSSGSRGRPLSLAAMVAASCSAL